MAEHKSGLVLEGGGMRGIYTAGVLDVFMEERIKFDGVIGVSAGAVHGASYVAGQKGRNIRYYKKYCNDPRFMSYRSWIKTGDVVGEEFAYHELPEKLDPFDYAAFKKSDIAFYSVVTNVLTGKAEYPRIMDMHRQMELLRASATLPYISKIVRYKGKLLLDGGCADSIPLVAMEKLGYDSCVVVRTRHEGYRKKPGKAVFPKTFYKKYPLFARTLINRAAMYNAELEEVARQQASGEAFVITPSHELKLGRMEHDPEKLQKVYMLGRKDARKQLPALRRWLAAKQEQAEGTAAAQNIGENGGAAAMAHAFADGSVDAGEGMES